MTLFDQQVRQYVANKLTEEHGGSKFKIEEISYFSKDREFLVTYRIRRMKWGSKLTRRIPLPPRSQVLRARFVFALGRLKAWILDYPPEYGKMALLWLLIRLRNALTSDSGGRKARRE